MKDQSDNPLHHERKLLPRPTIFKTTNYPNMAHFENYYKLYSFLCVPCKREREIIYLTTNSTHFIYGYMASDMVKETRCRHIGYSYRLTARVLLYAPSHRQDNTYHSLCYTSRGALAWTRNICTLQSEWPQTITCLMLFTMQPSSSAAGSVELPKCLA